MDNKNIVIILFVLLTFTCWMLIGAERGHRHVLTLDVNMYVLACGTSRPYHIKKNDFVK